MRVKTMPRYIRERGTRMKNKNDFADLEDHAKKPVESKKESVVHPRNTAGEVAAGQQRLATKNAKRESTADNERTAVNLTMKRNNGGAENQTPSPSVTASTDDDKLRGSVLYKILTDPSFDENIRKNREAMKYSCHYCKQSFMNERDLAEHLVVRKDVFNQIACCACGKTFTQKRYLRYHQRCHADRNKFVCEICTRKYSRLDNLTRHNTFHTNPDKYRCNVCSKAFARKDLMKKHQRCHENKVGGARCNVCEKHFKGPHWLEAHRKTCHSDVEPFQ